MQGVDRLAFTNVSDFDDEPLEPANAKAPKGNAPSTTSDDGWEDDWDEERSSGGRDLTVVYAIIAAAVVIVLVIILTRPKDDNNTQTQTTKPDGTEEPAEIVKNWQGPVSDNVGEKAADVQARVASAPGVYIWTDFWGWHIRSNNTKPVEVTVAADQVRQKATDDYEDADEKDDAFKTEATVTIPAGDGKTGVGFDLGGSESATFTITMDGVNVPASQIFLGGGTGVATANPVVFSKA